MVEQVAKAQWGGRRPGAGMKKGSVRTVQGVCRKFPNLKLEFTVAMLRIAQAEEAQQPVMVRNVLAALRQASHLPKST